MNDFTGTAELIEQIKEARVAFPVHAHMLSMRAATPSLMPATTRGAYRIGSAIDRSSTRRATRN
jgi:hypothetical protein